LSTGTGDLGDDLAKAGVLEDDLASAGDLGDGLSLLMFSFFVL
jgi:hypothetical protein